MELSEYANWISTTLVVSRVWRGRVGLLGIVLFELPCTEPALPNNEIHINSEETDSDSHGDQSEYGNSSDSDGEDYL